ncbi:MAG: SDR family oxidoreductase, partial [Deltaproteobacteria bacterium]|nr:SDR family oxidoreductase [Deltaproteobacteria bacterium]
MRVGVTGHEGFVGRHVLRALSRRGVGDVVGLDRSQGGLLDREAVARFLDGLDAVIHLAGVNRAESEAEFVQGNVEATGCLVDAVEAQPRPPAVVFSSSIHAGRPDPYGRTKLAAEELILGRAEQHPFPAVVFRVTNVFGEGCRPFYNSVVATFCHQVARGEEPKILVDSRVALVPVSVVADALVEAALSCPGTDVRERRELTSTDVIAVSDLLARLRRFAGERAAGRIPELSGLLDRHLYATLLSHYPLDRMALAGHPWKSDARGELVELFHFERQGQIFFSTTRPGVVRGHHYHARKVERFLVVRGEAELRLRHVDDSSVTVFRLTGAEPRIVEIPVSHAHCIENTGCDDMILLIWADELFDPSDPDT